VRIWERWTAERIRRRVREFEAALPPGAWPNWVVGNHDVDRVATRMNHDGLAAERARLAALLLLTLRGTPFLYYGDERAGEYHVPAEKPRILPGSTARRDPERTPMQWTRSGGFSRAEPWLPYGDLARNVEDERADSDSMLSFQRKLIWTRRRSDALLHGAYADLPDVPDGVYAFTRTHGSDRTLTVLNFDARAVSFDLPPAFTVAATLAATHGDPPPSQRLELRGLEGRLLQLA
jgi:alpha-glucosidase